MINDQYFNQELVLQKIFRLFLMMFKIKPFDRMNSFHSGLLCMHILKYAADICSSLVILFIMRSALSCLPCCRRISRCRGEQKTPAQLYVTEQQLQFYTRPIWEQRFISTRVENMSDLFILNVCFCRSQSCDLSRSAEVCWLLSVSQDQVRCGLSSKARTPSLTLTRTQKE